MEKLIKFGFVAAFSMLATISHAEGIYSDKEINGAIQCILDKIKPSDYPTFIKRNIYMSYGPKGTVSYNSQGQAICEHRYTNEELETAYKVGRAYSKELFEMCNASGIRKIVSLEV